MIAYKSRPTNQFRSMSKLRAVGCSCFAMAVVLPIVLIVVGEVVLPQVIVARLNELRHGYTELGRSESHSPWGLPHWPSLARPLSALLAVVRRAPARWVPKRGRGRGGTPVERCTSGSFDGL